jgi:hypothetical protein
MSPNLESQCRADGFSRGLLKCAATAALENAARIVVNPATRRTMASLGEDLYRASTRPGHPIDSAFKFLIPQYGQMQTIRALRNQAAQVLRSTPMHLRSGVQEELHRNIADALAEVGQGAQKRLHFMHTTLPTAAGVGIGATAGLAGGAYAGRQERDSELRGDVESAPLMKRLQYALFPQSLIPKSKPFYERFSDQDSSIQ